MTSDTQESECPFCWTNSGERAVAQTGQGYVAPAEDFDLPGEYIIAPKWHIRNCFSLPDLWQRTVGILLHEVPDFEQWQAFDLVYSQNTWLGEHVYARLVRRDQEIDLDEVVRLRLGRTATSSE